jgi:hypothetical protein
MGSWKCWMAEAVAKACRLGRDPAPRCREEGKLGRDPAYKTPLIIGMKAGWPRELVEKSAIGASLISRR